MKSGEELLKEAVEQGERPIQRMRPSHKELIDLIIAHPFCDGLWLSAHTGYTRSWLSTLMASDLFQAELAARREQIIDPMMKATLEEQARGLFARSIEVLREKFDQPARLISDQLALQGFSATARALGYGNRVEPTAKTDETEMALVKHADNLVALLRREKSRLRDEEIIDVPNEG